MEKRFYLVFLVAFLFQIPSSTAQDSTAVNRNRIKFTPLELVLFGAFIKPAPAIELSYERLLPNKFSFQIIGNYLLPLDISSWGDYSTRSLGGGKIGFEVRRYKNENHRKWYVAIEAYQEYAKYFDFLSLEILDENGEYLYWDQYEMKLKRNASTINVKGGIILVSRKFILDMYVGVGVKYRAVSYLNSPYEYYQLGKRIDMNPQDPFRVEGNFWVPNLAANIRIGIPF